MSSQGSPYLRCRIRSDGVNFCPPRSYSGGMTLASSNIMPKFTRLTLSHPLAEGGRCRQKSDARLLLRRTEVSGRVAHLVHRCRQLGEKRGTLFDLGSGALRRRDAALDLAQRGRLAHVVVGGGRGGEGEDVGVHVGPFSML